MLIQSRGISWLVVRRDAFLDIACEILVDNAVRAAPLHRRNDLGHSAHSADRRLQDRYCLPILLDYNLIAKPHAFQNGVQIARQLRFTHVNSSHTSNHTLFSLAKSALTL